MSRRSSPQTYAAFCEEFDEDANEALPETRKVANVAAKRSKPDLGPSEGTDIASDSGYSSRTAATAGSGESLPVGTRDNISFSSSDQTVTPREFARPRGREKTRTASLRGKEKEAQEHRSSSRRATMEAPVQRPASRPAPQRSSSKSQKWEATNGRHPHGTCYECDQFGYHNAVPMSPVDNRQMDYSPYIHQSVHPYDVPQSPRTARYPPLVTQETRPSPGSGAQARPQRSNSYHSQNRPVSYHGAMPDMRMMYMPPMSPSPYDHGPPPSASAYTNSPSYYPSYMGNASGMPPSSPYEAPAQPNYDRPRASSTSRSTEKSSRRRSSNAYGPPVVDYANSASVYYNEAPERKPSRESRARRQSQSYDHDEAYYLMPPPPAPPPKKKASQDIPVSKRPTPRKSSTANASPTVHRPHPFDLSDLRAALPARTGRRPSRDRSSAERVPSDAGRNPGRTTSYHDPVQPARVSVEGSSRNRRSSVYGLEQHHQPKDFEQKQREAEEYQAARTPRSSGAFSLENIMKARYNSQRGESDSDSQKTRSDSSRGSDAKTKNGSGVTSRQDDDSITMIIRGVKIGLSGDSVEGKKINVRSGEEGGVELNIEGRRPKRYIMSRSDSISMASRKEIEDVRRTREDIRSERASRRSSRSGYSGRGLLE